MIESEEIQIIKKRDIFCLQDNFKIKADIKSLLMTGNEGDKDVEVSIVIPTYNRIDQLKRGILSAADQAGYCGDYEIVVCDNTTDERTKAECLQMIKSLDIRNLRYYQNETNLGMFENWNRCIALAKGEFVVIVHSDDWLDEKYLRETVPIMREHQSIDWLSVRPLNKLISFLKEGSLCKVPFNLVTISGFFPIQCSIFRRNSVIKHGGFTTASYIEDVPFKKTMTWYCNVYNYNKELYYQGSDEKSFSNNVNWENELVYDYYYDLNSIKKRSRFLQVFFLDYLKKSFLRKIEQFISGNNYISHKVDIDTEALLKACEIEDYRLSWFRNKVSGFVYYIDLRYGMSKMRRSDLNRGYRKKDYGQSKK